MIVFSGAVFASALCSSVLSLLHAWSRESLGSRIGAVELVSKALAVILVLSLIIFLGLRYLSLCSCRSMETMQWSEMNPCVVALVTLTSPCSCVKMRSSVLLKSKGCHCDVEYGFICTDGFHSINVEVFQHDNVA